MSAGKFYEIINELSHLNHSSKKINGLRRYLCIPLVLFTSLIGFGPVVDPEGYQSPVFETFRVLAPLHVWGYAFLVASALGLFVLVTGNIKGYILTHFLTLFLSIFWTLTLLKSKFIDKIPVSVAAFGLWVFPVTFCIVILTTRIIVFDKKDMDKL